MLKRFFCFIPGSVRVSTTDVARASNVILHRGMVCNGSFVEGGRLYFELGLFDAKQNLKVFDGLGIPYRIEGRSGLFPLLERYKLRFGLWIGLIAFIALLYVSESFVWSVSVRSEEKCDSDEIIGNLEELGFGVGSYIPRANVLALSNSYLLRYDGLSYISINVIGNCAEVTVIPKKEVTSNDKKDEPSSIVASRDGVIRRTEVLSGQTVRQAGQAVQKGDVIVSGLVNDERDGTYRLVRARAKVFAETNREFYVSVPLSRTQLIRNERKTVEKSLCFFGKEIKISKNSCVLDDKYDIMTVNKPLVLWGRIRLPISFKTTTAALIEESEVTVSKTEAIGIASSELASLIGRQSIEVLSISKEYIMEKDRLLLVCRVRCIEDIASEVPMTDTHDLTKKDLE